MIGLILESAIKMSAQGLASTGLALVFAGAATKLTEETQTDATPTQSPPHEISSLPNSAPKHQFFKPAKSIAITSDSPVQRSLSRHNIKNLFMV